MTERFRESLTEAVLEIDSDQNYVVIRQVGESAIAASFNPELGGMYHTHVGTAGLPDSTIARYKDTFLPAVFADCIFVEGPTLCVTHTLPKEYADLESAQNKRTIFRILRKFFSEELRTLEGLQAVTA